MPRRDTFDLIVILSLVGALFASACASRALGPPPGAASLPSTAPAAHESVSRVISEEIPLPGEDASRWPELTRPSPIASPEVSR